MKKKLIILISILTLSCTKDDTSTLTDKNALNLVTGINFRETPDANEVPLHLGNPNVFANIKFLIYPNPATEYVSIAALENVTDVWFIPANPEKIHQDVNFSSLLNTDLYSEQSISSHSNFSLSGQSSKNLIINIGTLAKGYYRVFVKTGGKIYWDNLYKYENQGDNAEQFTSLTTFWK